MAAIDLDQRRAAAQVAIHERYARSTPHDRAAATAAARDAARQNLIAKLTVEVDPDGTLDPAEREFRLRHAISAHYSRLSLMAAQSRRADGGDTQDGAA